jgi:hypothetical protein
MSPSHRAADRRVRSLLLVVVLSILLAACGGGGDDEVLDCGQDNQTGPRAGWTHVASQCFRDRYQNGLPATATVVEAREGVGLATVEYIADGSDTFTRRVIPSGGVATVTECTRLGASRVDGRTQLDPLDCEPVGS